MLLTLRIRDQDLSMCRLAPGAAAPAEILGQHFTAFIRTHNETTLVCPSSHAPKDAKVESGWIALELMGPFDFGATGILVQIAEPLAEAGVPIVALATFDTDYILIMHENRAAAIMALRNKGHSIHENGA